MGPRMPTDNPRAAAAAPRRRRSRWHWLWKGPLWLLALSVLQVAVLRVADPPFTSFMAIRQVEALAAGDRAFRIAYDWRDADAVAACLPLAVVAAEDQNFARHRGFDFEAIDEARRSNARGGRVRGGSTITQQLAKNLFLWSGGGYVRKAVEAWYALWIELLWPKARILEVYVNVAEFGDGVYGAQAAARTFFGRDAAALSTAHCARLAAVLPNPKRYSAAEPGPYVRGRAQWIERNMRRLGGESWLRTLR